MKTVQINTQDLAGGAARLTYQLHKNLRELGHESRMLVGYKTSNDPDVFPVDRGGWRLRGLRNRLLSQIENMLSLQYWLRRFPHGWLNLEPLCSADVVNLHNLHGGYFNYLALPQLTAAKPTCWSLHDMWAFTGHCAYSYECVRWKTGCYSCPLLRARVEAKGLLGPEATLFDQTRLIWKTKRRLYGRSHLTIITGSTWMKEQVDQSILAEFAAVVSIPDGADIHLFHPVDRVFARQSLGIPAEAPVILLYATPDNARKGLKYAIEALNRLQMDAQPWAISVGHIGALDSLGGRYRILDVGYLQTDVLRNLCHCAADLFLLPTLADNLPLTVLDSLASGVPIVSFDVGGIPDAVRHMETGYLAAYKDTDDLAHGLEVILKDADLRTKMSRRCREVAVQEYSLELQARRYAELYETLIAETRQMG